MTPVSEPHPTLTRDDQQAVGVELQDMLVELIDLALVGQHLQWSVVGTGSRGLRLELGEFVPRWRELANAIAERAVALGAWPDGQARTVADGCEAVGFEAVEVGAVPDEDVRQDLADRLAECATRARARAGSVGEVDPPSQDVLYDVVRTLERHLWMLRAQRAR